MTSLALKVKGIESFQDVPGRASWPCQHRAREPASFSPRWPPSLPWQSRALLCAPSPAPSSGWGSQQLNPSFPLSVCCQTAAVTWENTCGKLPLLKGGEAELAGPDELQSWVAARGWGSSAGSPHSRWVGPRFPSTCVPCAIPDRGRPCLARVSLATGPRDAVQSICHQLSLFCSALYAHSIVSRGR